MKLLIVANWKCNPLSRTEAKRLFDGIKRGVENIKDACLVRSQRLSNGVEVVICPPFTFMLSNIQHLISNIKIGSQDCFWEEKGAYTGEISAPMLKNLGVEYVIIGHSERRKYFGETDEMLNKKLKAAIKAGLKPILCVGETEEERKKGITNKVIKNQLIKDLKDIRYPISPEAEQVRYGAGNIQYPISIAYEPVWAIGTGNPCLPEDVRETGLFIQKILTKIYNKKTAQRIRIIYGGSANSKNAADYIFKAGMQGLLVGGVSLDAKEFVKIVKLLTRF